MNRNLPYPFLIISLLFVSISNSFSQTLDWSSSFSPAWTAGAASRTATGLATGLDVSVTVTNSQPGSYQYVTGSTIAPAVNNNNATSGFFIIAGSSDCLEIDVDWSSESAYVDVVYTFTKPVYNLVFRVGDIDKNNSLSVTYIDRVTVTAMNGSTAVLPSSITPVNATGNYITISGNVIHANTTYGQGGNASTNSTSTSSQQGTAEVNFGSQGLTQLTIRYDNHPSAQSNPALQAIAIGNLSFSQVNISGTVWNDINNSANNTFTNIFSAGEAGTDASGLYVNLVNSLGNVVTSSAVAANGTYSIAAPQNTNNLTLRLSTTQGIAGSAAPANSVSANWTHTSPLQTAAFNTTTVNITGKDFGIEELPQSATNIQSQAGNPGGYNFTAIVASAFQTGTGGNPSTSDAGGGTVTGMRITSFPTHTNAIRINGTTYINGSTCPPSATCVPWPAGGVIVPYINGAGPSVAVSIDPVEGNVTPVITIAAIDNAGKEDATPGTITLPFVTIPLAGLVFNDANGDLLQNGTEQVVNGSNTGGGLLPGATLYANLVDASGIVIATANVQNNGTYNFPHVPQNNGNLIIQINTVRGSVGVIKPALVLPPGWASVGENKNGQGGSADAIRNSEIVLTTGSVTITLQNFCLDRLPVAQAKFYTIALPPVNGIILLNGTGPNPGSLSGNDAEDGVLGSASRVAITALPVEGNELWYNGSQITLGSNGSTPPAVNNPFLISNFNPTLLYIKATALGSTSATFNYAFVDAASLQGSPAAYAIVWETPLPVTLTGFSGKADSGNTLLNWKVENQEDFDRYEIEYSASGSGGFQLEATVYSNNQLSGTYDFTLANMAARGSVGYYRLKMIDKNGTYRYSHVITVRFDKLVTVDLRPTLLSRGEPVSINISGNVRHGYQVRLSDMNGRILQERHYRNENNIMLQTHNLVPGSYIIRVVGEGLDRVYKIVVQ